MIPKINNILSTTIKMVTLPSKTYKLDDTHIANYCDKLEAMKQVVYKILNTNRYEHIIYSWNYGIEISDLLGSSSDYIHSEIKRRITEALIQDDRIKDVDDFVFKTIDKNSINVIFTVHTIFGKIETGKEVKF